MSNDEVMRWLPAFLLVAGLFGTVTVFSHVAAAGAPSGDHPQVGDALTSIDQARPYNCDPNGSPCLRVTNEFIRADIGPFGRFTLGTTGGDPDTAFDDDRELLYGYRSGGTSQVGSGYATVRIEGADGIVDFVPNGPNGVVRQRAVDDQHVETVWQPPGPYAVAITETVRFAISPFSGRSDLLEAHFEIHNGATTTLDIGLRSLLDVKIGNNDGAPYFIPGIGAISTETAYVGPDVPAYWLAFEDPAYDPSRLRGLGVLQGEDITRPDEFWIVDWIRAQRSPWRYAVDATRTVTDDSAVALLWDPKPLAPGASRTVNLQYGIAANRGGRVFLTAPVQTRCGANFLVSVFVSNFDVSPLTGGNATLQLPPGLRLAPNETVVQPVPEIDPGDTASVAWRIQVDPGVDGSFPLGVDVTFDGGLTLSAEERIQVTCEGPTTTPSPTAVATRTATPTRHPLQPGACDAIQGRVPPAAIASALANPSAVYGWGLLANPNAPRSPVNPPRRWLSLRSLSTPYSPIANPLIYKAGCP